MPLSDKLPSPASARLLSRELEMRRITVEIDANRVVVYVRGRLTGSSVSELENCWKRVSSFDTPDSIRLDLGGVTSVDKNGKALLSEMIAKGIQLQGDGPMMISVEKIVSDAQEI